MKLLILVSSILLLAASCLQAEPMADISQASFDFGRVTQGKLLTHSFWIKSVGDDTLVIEKIWPGCGCTQIPLKDSILAPGDSIPLTIQFSTGKFMGQVEKSPTITSNANSKPCKLFIRAYVTPTIENDGPLLVRPEILDVSQFSERQRRQAKFHIENTTDRDLDLAVVDSALKSFEIKLPGKVKAGETIEVAIRVFEDKIESDFKESISFEAVGVENGIYTLPIKRIFRPKH